MNAPLSVTRQTACLNLYNECAAHPQSLAPPPLSLFLLFNLIIFLFKLVSILFIYIYINELDIQGNLSNIRITELNYSN